MKKYAQNFKFKIKFQFKMKKTHKILSKKFRVIKKINKTVNYIVKKAKQNTKTNQTLQVSKFYYKIKNKE